MTDQKDLVETMVDSAMQSAWWATYLSREDAMKMMRVILDDMEAKGFKVTRDPGFTPSRGITREKRLYIGEKD